MTRRPAEILTGALGSALALLIAFGVNLTDDQTAAILASVAWVPAIVTAAVELWRSRAGVLANPDPRTQWDEETVRRSLEATVNRPRVVETDTVGDIVAKKTREQPPAG